MASSSSTPKPSDKPAGSKSDTAQQPRKAAATLEEDDEFEDFPVEDWPAAETEAASQAGDGATAATADHLWEESWDDDDTSDDFSTQLRDELKKVEAAKRR